MKHVVVIGGGHSGLVAAVRLAVAGLDVTVLEHAAHPGGAVSTKELTLPGFLHDAGAGFFPQTLASPAFARLPNVIGAVDWVNPDVPLAHPFLDGSAIALHRDVEATVASLDRASGAGDAWRTLMARLLPHQNVLCRTALSRLPPLWSGTSAALRLRRDGVELARRMLGSGASFGRDLFGAEKAAAWFAGPVIHSDLSPGAAGGGALAFFLLFLGHAVGWPYPRGGAARLSHALTAELEGLAAASAAVPPLSASSAAGAGFMPSRSAVARSSHATQWSQRSAPRRSLGGCPTTPSPSGC